MSTLYELTSMYQALLDVASDPDIDEQAFRDTLEGLDGEIEIKADGYAKVMKTLSADVEALDGEIERMTGRKKTLENRIDSMKRSLKEAMIATGKKKFKTALFSFAVQKNKASVVMDEAYIENIPDRFLIQQEPKINRTAIKEAIEAGEDLEGLAHLEQSESLRIR